MTKHKTLSERSEEIEREISAERLCDLLPGAIERELDGWIDGVIDDAADEIGGIDVETLKDARVLAFELLSKLVSRRLLAHDQGEW